MVVLLIGAVIVVGHSQTQQLPAPLVDRIGFPAGYQDTYKLLMTFDRPDTGQIRAIWGNDVAYSVQPGDPYPYGSIFIFEGWTSQRDAQNNILLDDQGHFIKNRLTTVFVMRKERGFGTAYGPIQNGEWEYVSYNPDGTYATPAQNSGGCAQCHLQAGKAEDFVFRSRELLEHANGTVPNGVMAHYTFLPKVLVTKVGAPVTFYNTDDFDHNLVTADRKINSGLVHQGASYVLKFDQPGTYNYTCTIHRGMTGAIVVQPADGQ